MLYHPCSDASEVAKLRTIVKSCIRKHVITPYSKLSKERPLALVTWGCKLLMSKVESKESVDFIRKTAMNAPEDGVFRNGDYNVSLIERSKPVNGSGYFDQVLCPSYD